MYENELLDNSAIFDPNGILAGNTDVTQPDAVVVLAPDQIIASDQINQQAGSLNPTGPGTPQQQADFAALLESLGVVPDGSLPTVHNDGYVDLYGQEVTPEGFAAMVAANQAQDLAQSIQTHRLDFLDVPQTFVVDPNATFVDTDHGETYVPGLGIGHWVTATHGDHLHV